MSVWRRSYAWHGSMSDMINLVQWEYICIYQSMKTCRNIDWSGMNEQGPYKRKKKNAWPKTAELKRRSYIPKLYPPKTKLKSTGLNADLPASDLQYLTSETGYDEQEVKEWFKVFCKECPKRTLTRKKVKSQIKEKHKWNNNFRCFSCMKGWVKPRLLTLWRIFWQSLTSRK